MRHRAGIPFAVLAAVLLAAVGLPPRASAATRSEQKQYGEPQDGKALVYVVRTKRFVSALVPMYVYAGDQLLGVLANNCYSFAHVDPGERPLWNDWERAHRPFDFEPGRTYYFSAWAEIVEMAEEEGRRSIEEVRFYCSPSEEEIRTAGEQVAEREGTTEDFFAEGGDQRGKFRTTRERHIAPWPRIDLSGYTVLVIEDFEVTDPEAAKRKKKDLLMAAPARLANLVEAYLAPGTFAEVRRGALEQPLEGALVLRVELTQYKPGSPVARAMLAGAGASRLDFTARLIDGGSGSELASFADERAWGWGGEVGARGGIDVIEENLAHELAVYLERRTGAAATGEDGEAGATPESASAPAEP